MNPPGTPYRSYRSRWLLLGAFLLALGLAVTVELYLERKGIESRESDRLTTQARIIAENLETRLESANLALAAIRDELTAQAPHATPHLISEHLKMLTVAMPGIRTMNVVDARGRLIASNRADLVGIDISHREYFQTVIRHPDPGMLYVSPPFETMLGAYAINIARMIPGARGEFAGIVTATLDPQYFSGLMASVLYAPDMWDALGHGDGQLFLMEPERPNLRGMSLAQPGSFFTQHRESGKLATVLSGKVYSTGENRMMAQRTVFPQALRMDKPLVVAVSRDLDAIYAPWRIGVFARGGLLAVIVAISSLGLYIHQRRQTKLEALAAQARQQAERLSFALDQIPTYIYMKNRQRRYVYANKPTLGLFGCTAENLADSPDTRFFPPEAVARLHEIDTRVLELGEDTAEEVVVQTADDKRRVYWEIKTPIYEDADKTRIWGLCGISTDITERKELEVRLERQAHLDYLTGLNNRRHLMELGEVELARAQRYGKPLSVFMLDIDHFKRFNDTYGHKAGDLVLQKLAEVMRDTLRTMDIVGRMGGEEFAVLLPETGLEQAAEVAERLRAAAAQTPAVLDAGLPLHFAVSIGVATLQDKESNLDILLHAADRALYRAKEAGRDRVVVMREAHPA